jgi:hypothetical protein
VNMDPIERQRDIDQWLESALSQYGKVEPRTGLESRVLANLQSEKNRIASQRRWWWVVGTAAALAVVVAAVWIGESGHVRHPVSTAGTSATTKREDARELIQTWPAPQFAVPQIAYPSKVVAKSRPANRPTHDLAVARTPKQDQFPSPQPLSEQEQILVRYVVKYPEIAALVAQDQAETLQRDREEEAAEAAKDSVQ